MGTLFRKALTKSRGTSDPFQRAACEKSQEQCAWGFLKPALSPLGAATAWFVKGYTNRITIFLFFLLIFMRRKILVLCYFVFLIASSHSTVIAPLNCSISWNLNNLSSGEVFWDVGKFVGPRLRSHSGTCDSQWVFRVRPAFCQPSVRKIRVIHDFEKKKGNYSYSWLLKKFGYSWF